MFELIKTYTNEIGFHLTPIKMEGVGLIFLPKELEEQLGYGNLANTVRQSESFIEGAEYIVLKDSNLSELKNLLNTRNSIASVMELKHCPAFIVLTESGLRNLLALSRKPEIHGFREWVSVEVLPGINQPEYRCLRCFK